VIKAPVEQGIHQWTFVYADATTQVIYVIKVLGFHLWSDHQEGKIRTNVIGTKQLSERGGEDLTLNNEPTECGEMIGGDGIVAGPGQRHYVSRGDNRVDQSEESAVDRDHKPQPRCDQS
jgi:hypothetical protein